MCGNRETLGQVLLFPFSFRRAYLVSTQCCDVEALSPLLLWILFVDMWRHGSKHQNILLHHEVESNPRILEHSSPQHFTFNLDSRGKADRWQKRSVHLIDRPRPLVILLMKLSAVLSCMNSRNTFLSKSAWEHRINVSSRYIIKLKVLIQDIRAVTVCP